MVLYYLNVKENRRGFYFPDYLWSGACIVTDFDKNHVWVRFIRTEYAGYRSGLATGHVVSSTHRYVRDDVDLTLIDNQESLEYV